jgi:hypothetical protein
MPTNSKNPTALFFDRMARAKAGAPGTLVSLMTNFFKANYGLSDLPKTAADFILYDQLAVVGLTSASFFTGAYTTNRSNFPGSFVLPQGEHAIITGIKFMFGANATVSSTNWEPGVSDALVKQGLVSISINGQVVTTQLPLTAFDNNALSATAQGSTDENRGYFFFYEPLVLLGQQQIALNITWGTAPATANANLRCELHGVRFIGN